MTKTKKRRSKGGGIGSSRVKNESLKKKVSFNSAENEYHSDASRDSLEMVKFTKKDKKDQYQAYLDEAEEMNDEIKEKN